MHVPDPTVIVMRPPRPRGLVISMSVLVTLGLVVGGLLAYGNLSNPTGSSSQSKSTSAGTPSGEPSSQPPSRSAGGVAATGSVPPGTRPGGSAAGSAGAVPVPGSLTPGAGVAPGLPEPTVTPLGNPATPTATETTPAAAAVGQPVAPGAAAAPPGAALQNPARPALAASAEAQADIDEAPEPAWLELDVEPADATVTVAGEIYTGRSLERMGPFAPGPLALRIEAPEHETIEQVVDLQPGETERMSLALPAVALGPGKFRVRSSPSGATVLIDGKVRGVTPITLELASGKTYELALSQQGYEPWRTLIEPEVGKTQKIGADMERLSSTRTTAQRSTPEPQRSTPAPERPAPAPERPAPERPAPAPEEPEPAKKERDISVPASVVGNAGRGRALFERCRSCHGSSAPALSPRDQTQAQWSRFLALRRHSRHAELRPLFSASELADVKAFLLENAADVKRGMAAGVR